MMRVTLSVGLVVAFMAPVWAGKYNAVLDIGDKAPHWTGLGGVDGNRHALADLSDKDVVVVVFTCNSCPVASDYEDRILAFTKKYAAGGKVALVAINVNRLPEDRLDKMKQRAAARGFDFPYLYDDSQNIGKAFGAAFTPEFFVLDKDRRVVFMGGMDDSSDQTAVKNHYLEEAVDAVLAGRQPEVAEVPAIGCRVRYERARGDRPAKPK